MFLDWKSLRTSVFETVDAAFFDHVALAAVASLEAITSRAQHFTHLVQSAAAAIFSSVG